MSKTPFILSLGTFTRPNDTTQYTAADLVANSTTAGSVVPLSVAGLLEGGVPSTFEVTRAKIHSSHTTLTNGTFRVHLYVSTPGTPTNGDNGAHLFDTTVARGYVEVALTSVGKAGQYGTAAATQPILITTAAGTLYATLEAAAAYTPKAQEVFGVTLEGYLHTP